MEATTSTEGGFDVVSIEHGGLKEIFATALPGVGEDLPTLLHRLWGGLPTRECEALELRVFGATNAFSNCERTLNEIGTPGSLPLVFVQGDGCLGSEIAGVQLHAVVGAPVETVQGEGWPVGRIFEDEFARYCVLGNLHSPEASRPRDRQTQDTIEQMMRGLFSAGMDIHSLVRTWFFIDDILGWYPDFNRVRSEIYSAEGVFGRFLPASTGIGGRNPHGASVVGSALATQAKSEGVTVKELPSPLQCPAFDYGSSFSRAAELETPDCRSVFVSGTASIDPDGTTVHIGEVDAQIDFTFDIVGAILESRGMDYGDVVRGNAYFKDSGEAGRFEAHRMRHGLPASRIIVSQNHVCRDDLLFEMEVQAVRARGSE